MAASKPDKDSSHHHGDSTHERYHGRPRHNHFVVGEKRNTKLGFFMKYTRFNEKGTTDEVEILPF